MQTIQDRNHLYNKRTTDSRGILQRFMLSVWDSRQQSLNNLVELPSRVKDPYSGGCKKIICLGCCWTQVNSLRIATDASAWGWGSHIDHQAALGKWGQSGAKKYFSNAREPSGKPYTTLHLSKREDAY